MSITLRTTTTVLPGHRIEISAPDLDIGDVVEVIVTPAAAETKPSALEIIKSLAGHRLYKTAEEADRYLRAERDSWDR